MFTTTEWHIKEPQISARGAKSCTIQDATGGKIFFTLGAKSEPVTTPFGATAFNDELTCRKTIEFNLSPAQELQFDKFDKWSIGYLALHSERLFKKQLTEEQVREGYRSPVTRKAGYGAHLRCKINTSGKGMVRCWDVNGQRMELPADLRYSDMVPRVNISHLWMMSREYGWVFQTNDLLLAENQEECPFDGLADIFKQGASEM
jgi:hypothetical protein